MKDLIGNTLEKIKTGDITPESRWKYLLKKFFRWFLFVATVAAAALFLAAAYSNLSSLDWDLYRFVHENRVVYFLSLVPYPWFILAAILLLAAFFEFRRTPRGYRYSRLAMWALVLGGFLAVGAWAVFSGFGSGFNTAITRDLPAPAQRLMVTKESQWMQPDKGFLAGKILSVSGNDLQLKDLAGKDWKIQIGPETLVRPAAQVSKNGTIKIIGQEKNVDTFSAQEIRPWEGRGTHAGTAGGTQKGTARSTGARGGGMHSK